LPTIILFSRIDPDTPREIEWETLYYYLFVFAEIFLYYVFAAIDRYLTSKFWHIDLENIGNKQALWITKPLVFVAPMIIMAATGGFNGEEVNGLMIGIFCGYAVLVSIGLIKNQYNIPLFDESQLQWAKDNKFIRSKQKQLIREYNEGNFTLSFDRANTIASSVGEFKNNRFENSEEASIYIKTENPLKKSFLLPSEKNELWEKIGPEHLEFIQKNHIEIFSTHKWVVARVKFGTLKKIDLEELFEAMKDILEEVKYRSEAGFKYSKY